MARDADKAARRDEEVYKRSLCRVLDTPEGRRIVWRLLERGAVFHSTFCGEETHRSAMLEGRRSMALELFDDVMAFAPHQYAVMQTENTEEPNA